MQLNEAIKVNKYKKLKDSIHDIITTIPKDKWLSTPEISKKLKKYNIAMPSKLLTKFLTDWKNDKKNPIFTYDDNDWLFFDKENNIVFSTLHFDKPASVGKSKRKIRKEEIKKAEEAEEKKRKSDIDKLKEEEKTINCPIPSEVIFDTFKDIDVDDVSKIKKNIHNKIENEELDFLYEPAWDYMIKLGTNTISENGLGLELKEDTWKNHKPDDQWIVPEEKDLDKGSPIWYFKYGKGIINDISGNMLEIDFDDGEFVKTIKKLKTEAVLRNKSIRIDKDYIKKESKKKGYDIAYLKDLKTNDEVYHKTRKKNGTVKSSAFVGDDNIIKFTFDNKTINISFDEFLKDQNILVKHKEKIEPTSWGVDTKKQTYGDWVKIEDVNDLKPDMDILYGAGRLSAKITFVGQDFIKFKNSYIDLSWNLIQIKQMGIWIKNQNTSTFITIKNIDDFKNNAKEGGEIKYGNGNYDAKILNINYDKDSVEIKINISNNIIDFNIDRLIKLGLKCEENKSKSNIKKNIEPKWKKVTSFNELKVGMQIQYSLNRIDGTIKKIDSLIFVDNDFGSSVYWNKYYFINTIGIWIKNPDYKTSTIKRKFKWSNVSLSLLKKGDTIKIDNPSLETFIGEIIDINKSKGWALPKYTVKNDKNIKKEFSINDIEHYTYKKVYIDNNNRKQLNVFDQENRELNKFKQEDNNKPFDINDYKKVDNINELSVGDNVYIKFKNKTGKIDKLNNGLISIIGDNLNITLSQITIENGSIYKRKQIIKSFNNDYKTTGNIGFNKNKTEWVKITDISELKKGMRIKNNRNIYTLDSIGNGYMTLKSKSGTSSWTIQKFIQDGIYKEKTNDSTPDGMIRIKNVSELKPNMIVYFNGKKKRINDVDSQRISMGGEGISINADTNMVMNSGLFVEKTKKELPSPNDGWKKISKKDLIVGTKIYSILYNAYGEIESIKDNSIKIKLNEPKFKNGHKIIAYNTNKNHALKEFLVKENEDDVDVDAIYKLVKHFKSFKSEIILRAAEFVSDYYKNNDFEKIKKLIRTGITFGYINKEDREMILKVLNNAKTSLERYKDKKPLQKTNVILKYLN